MATMLRNLIDELYSSQPLGTLYHYTTLKGLMGIVEHRKIWATDPRFLGDRTALRALGEEINRQIGVRLDQNLSDKLVLELLRSWVCQWFKQNFEITWKFWVGSICQTSSNFVEFRQKY